MTTAGEGEASYGGGAGGKFRKRPLRRPQTTPYDRPTTIIRNPRSSEGWLSKLVDPASKFVSSRAFKFFSNFRKRLTEAEHEPRDVHQATVPNNCNGAREPDIAHNGNFTNSGISELEQMFNRKTFTRSEIDHLTELLRSRTVESPTGDEEKSNEGNLSKPLPDLERRDIVTRIPFQESRNDDNKFQRINLTPGFSSRVLEEDVASPAELAKAYMVTRPSKVSPSMLGSRSQALKEETSLLNHASVPSKSSTLSLASKSLHHVGSRENGFTSLRSRGRSAIHSMARTPYSRVAGPTQYYSGPSSSSSQSALVHGQFGSTKLALKRRIVEDDSGSVGAIRRIRQKTNLSYQGPPATSGTGVGYSASQQHKSWTQKPFLLNDNEHKVSKDTEENGDDSFPTTNYSLVPLQSRETATKILQHLEKLTPKEKSSESKVIAAIDSSPFKLTPAMLRGQALRSLEDVDPTTFLQKQDFHKQEDQSNVGVQDSHDSISQQKNEFEENGPKESEVPLKLLTSSASDGGTVSIANTVSRVKNVDSVISKIADQRPQNGRAFRMYAPEDFLELDDEIHTNGLVYASLSEKREELLTDGKAVSSEEIIVDKPPALPDIKVTVGSASENIVDPENSGGLVAGKEKTGVEIPVSSSPSQIFQEDMPVQSTKAVGKFELPKDLTPSTPPLFGLSSKNVVDHLPSFTFDSTSPASESVGLSSGSWPDPKQESSFRSVDNNTQQKNLETDKGDDKNTQKAENTKGTSDSSPSAVLSTSASTRGIFSAASAQNSNLNNGILASSPSMSSSSAPALASSNPTSQIFGNGSINVLSVTSSSAMTSTGTTTTAMTTATAATNNGPSLSAAPSLFPAAPIFSSGSSMVLASTAATISTATGAETTKSEPKTEKETTFGNLNKPPFGGTPFPMASSSTGLSNPFGFGSSLTSSSGNDQSQGCLPTGSMFSSQAPPATGAAMVTKSGPIHFGTSGSSQVLGTSGSTSFTTSGSMFGSSVPAANPFGSGTTSSVFSSPSPLPSTGFFGSSSSSVAPTNSSVPPIVFGRSDGPSSSSVFSFSSATATTSSMPSLSQPQIPMFGNATAFGAPGISGEQMNSMEDSMAEDPVQAASTPMGPVFGQPSVLPSPAGFVFGSTGPSPSPLTSPFQFGGQQNPVTPQNPSPFQASSSLDFGGGGSFSLGSTGGGDKGARKIFRASRTKNKKK